MNVKKTSGEIRKLRKKLALIPGAFSLISKETSVSKAFVSMVFQGLRYSDRVIDAGIELAENHKKVSIKRTKRIKKL